MSDLPPEFWNLTLASNSLTVDDRITTIVETIQFVLFCCTMTIYIIIVWALVEAQQKRVDELTSPFFKLCLSCAGVDIWTLLTNYFGAMFAKWGWFVHVYLFFGKFYGHVYLYFAWSTGICQAMGVSVLASNRLSVMLFPTSFHRIWHGYRLWIAIAFQYFTGLIIGSATFFNQVELFRNGKNGIVPKFLNKTMTNAFFAIGGVFLLVNCIYLVATYFYLFWVIRKRQKRMRTPPNQIQFRSRSKERARMREARLFTMSTIIVGVQLVILLLFIFKGADILAFTSDQFYLVYNAISDLYASINPYLLWVFSDSLRKYILQRLGLMQKTKKITSITPISFVS